VLELENVGKAYELEHAAPVQAIADVSLTVPSGELVALYGPSGSGKSTLLLIAAAVLRPDSGAVYLDGRCVSGLPWRQAAEYRMRDVGFIRQSLDLVPGATAIDNAAMKLLGRKATLRQARRKVEPLLVELGLGERLDHRAEQLSMGERQRVMVARALSTEPRVLLADEPTGSLDTERGQAVLRLLSDLGRERNVATLLVTHDPDAVAVADQVISLRDGTLSPDKPDVRGPATVGRTARAGPK
jgi:putative ABC transport system ATP-binding protein